jgi:hypothetical protein
VTEPVVVPVVATEPAQASDPLVADPVAPAPADPPPVVVPEPPHAAQAPAPVPAARTPRGGLGSWIVGGGIAALALAVVLAGLGTLLVAQGEISGTAALVAGLLGVPGVALLVFGAVLLATEAATPRPAEPPAAHAAGLGDMARGLSEITRSGPPSRTLLTVGAGLVLAAVLLVMLVDGVVSLGGTPG